MKLSVFLDGEEVRRVVSVDTLGGLLVKLCEGERGEGHAAQPHLDLAEDSEVCTVALAGETGVKAEA